MARMAKKKNWVGAIMIREASFEQIDSLLFVGLVVLVVVLLVSKSSLLCLFISFKVLHIEYRPSLDGKAEYKQ